MRIEKKSAINKRNISISNWLLLKKNIIGSKMDTNLDFIFKSPSQT